MADITSSVDQVESRSADTSFLRWAVNLIAATNGFTKAKEVVVLSISWAEIALTVDKIVA